MGLLSLPGPKPGHRSHWLHAAVLRPTSVLLDFAASVLLPSLQLIFTLLLSEEDRNKSYIGMWNFLVEYSVPRAFY